MSNRACEKEMKGETERKIPLSVSLRPRDGERAWVRECGLERERLETKKTERTRELKLQF